MDAILRCAGGLMFLLATLSLHPAVLLSQVSVTFVDDTLWLGATGHRLQMLLDNKDSTAATIRVVAVHPSDALALLKPHSPMKVNAKSSDTLAIELRPVPSGRLVSRAYLVLEVKRGKTVGYVRSGPVTLGWRGHEPLEHLVKAELVASATAVSSSRPSDLFLVISNVAPLALHLGFPRVRLSSPGLSATVDSAELSPLTPGETRALRIKVVVEGDVAPGKYVASVELPVSSVPGRVFRNHLVRTQAIEVGVVGEAALLQLLGLPSFLVLPGFLALTTFNALRRRRKFLPSSTGAGTQVEWTQPEFWLVAISLSIAAALVYRLLPGHGDYLVAYSARDVVIVWTGAILVGGLGYLLRAAILNVQHWRRQALEATLTLSTRDTELDAIAKLGRQGRTIKQPILTLTCKGISEQVWTAGAPDWHKPDDRVLVFPSIDCTLPNLSDRDFLAFTGRLRQNIDSSSAVAVASDLAEGVKKTWLKVDYSIGPCLAGSPSIVAMKDLAPVGPDKVVRIV